jgi:amidase
LNRCTGDTSSALNRRQFVRNTLAVGTSAALAAPFAEGQNTAAARPKAFELDEVTISQLQEGMKSGQFTAQSLAEKYLSRIDEIDKRGPRVNSVIEVNPDALAIADALDKERKAKGVRGPMHGSPVLIKDNIDTADRMKTTAGSLALEDLIAARDAFVV